MPKDNVIKLYTQKTGTDPDALLEMAKGEFKGVFVMGINNAGNLEGRATVNISRAELMFYMEEIKLLLLQAPLVDSDNEDDGGD